MYVFIAPVVFLVFVFTLQNVITDILMHCLIRSASLYPMRNKVEGFVSMCVFVLVVYLYTGYVVYTLVVIRGIYLVKQPEQHLLQFSCPIGLLKMKKPKSCI